MVSASRDRAPRCSQRLFVALNRLLLDTGCTLISLVVDTGYAPNHLLTTAGRTVNCHLIDADVALSSNLSDVATQSAMAVEDLRHARPALLIGQISLQGCILRLKIAFYSSTGYKKGSEVAQQHVE